MNKTAHSYPRIPFLDNLRSLMVLLVVVFHAGLSYSNLVRWWPVSDANKSLFFNKFIFIFDTFALQFLYFIAGYFALPTLHRKLNAGNFVKSKLKSLGIPFVICVFFIIPIMPFLGRYTRAINPSVNFLEFWVQFVAGATDLKITYLGSGEIFSRFSHGHLWFISLLLFFFIAFALGHKIGAKFKPESPESRDNNIPPQTKTVIFTLIAVGLAMAFGSILVSRFFPTYGWANIYNVLIFRPVMLPLYLGYFIFGIFAYSKNWFTQKDLPGPIMVWLVGCLILSYAYLGPIRTLLVAHQANDIQVVVTFRILDSFLGLSIFCLLTNFAFRYWNNASRINQNLAKSSFYIYLVHLPIVLVLQLILLKLSINIFLKFIFVSILSIFASYGISHYIIQRSPKLSIVLLLSVFVLTSIFVSF